MQVLQRKELFFKLPLYPLTFGSHFCPSVSNAFFWHLLLFQQKKIKKTKKIKPQRRKKMQRREGAFKLSLCPFTFGSHFCPPASDLLFQTFSLSIFLFSRRRKEKKNKGKKTIKKKKKTEKGGSLLSSSHFAFSLLALAFGLMFLHFCFKHFLLASSSS